MRETPQKAHGVKSKDIYFVKNSFLFQKLWRQAVPRRTALRRHRT
jgi:hypothetical protein